MHPVAELYERGYDFWNKDISIRKSYMVAAVPRCGSTHFVLNLWRTGVLGAPMEYLNLRYLDRLLERLSGGDLESYWEALQCVRTSPNGVFGFKAFTINFQDLALKNLTFLSQITPDEVVYFTRRDKIAQAVSYARAVQTNSWFAGVRETEAPEYDAQEIATARGWIEVQETGWEKIFEMTGITPLRLFYEDHLADPEAAVAQVADLVGVELEPRARLHIPHLRPQSDGTSKAWVERYRNEMAESLAA